MKLLIVTEKPSVSRAIAPFVRQYWPTQDITFVHAMPYWNIRFNYPRGLSMAEYPLVSEPDNAIRAWDDWASEPLILAANGKLKSVPMSAEPFMAADMIVYAGSCDHTGAVGFEVMMQQIFGRADTRHLSCPAAILSSLEDASLDKAFKQIRPFSEACGSLLEYGRIKRYFDWNWFINSWVLIGAAERRVGLQGNLPTVSKYALQLLYAMRNVAPYSEAVLFRMMRDWPGTGRYQYANKMERPSLGSMSSMIQIVDNLLNAGLLTKVEEGGQPAMFKISVPGKRLLEQLHPDCRDLDLPFRLDAWCRKGEAAKPAIDRYIQTVFGKQLRYAASGLR